MYRRIRIMILLVIIVIIITACDNNEHSSLDEFEDVNNAAYQYEENVENSNDEIDKTEQTKDIIKSIQEVENNKIYSIVYAYKNNDRYTYAEVIGGVTNDRWYNYYELGLPSITKDDIKTDIVRENEHFKFYSKDSLIVSKDIKGQSLMYYGILEESLLGIGFDPFPYNNEYVIGTNGDWNALPRIPKALDENSYLIDIDDDGSNEIFTISKSNYVDKMGENLIKLEILVTDSGFELIDVLEYYMYEEETQFFEVMQLDLNGDNKLETITISDGHGLSIDIYEYDYQKLVPVIEFYLGD